MKTNLTNCGGQICQVSARQRPCDPSGPAQRSQSVDTLLDTPSIKTNLASAVSCFISCAFLPGKSESQGFSGHSFKPAIWIASKRPKGSGCSWWDQAWDTASTKSSCVGTRPWMTSQHATPSFSCMTWSPLPPREVAKLSIPENPWTSNLFPNLPRLAHCQAVLTSLGLSNGPSSKVWESTQNDRKSNYCLLLYNSYTRACHLSDIWRSNSASASTLCSYDAADKSRKYIIIFCCISAESGTSWPWYW